MHNNTKNLLDYAIFKGAKEIDIDSKDDTITVKFFVDGSWEYIIDFSRDESDLFKDIKTLTVKDTEIKNKFLGRFKLNKNKIKNVFNVSLLYKNDGERMILNLDNEEITPFELDNLGFKYNALKIVKQSIAKPNGLILVVGPVGSGITTTLYSLINYLNNNRINVSSIEDSIEYDLEEVNQTQTNIQNGYTIKDGLHHLVRQNSDIIMVNDINSKEASQSTLDYAVRGIPIFSSLNATDANSALTNFLQIGIDPMQISKAIDLIIAQKLVRNQKGEVQREYNVLKMNDDISELFKKPRVTESQIRRGIERIQV